MTENAMEIDDHVQTYRDTLAEMSYAQKGTYGDIDLWSFPEIENIDDDFFAGFKHADEVMGLISRFDEAENLLSHVMRDMALKDPENRPRVRAQLAGFTQNLSRRAVTFR